MASGSAGRLLAQAVPSAVALDLLVQPGQVGVVGDQLRVVLVSSLGHGPRPVIGSEQPRQPAAPAGSVARRQRPGVAGIRRLELVADGLDPEHRRRRPRRPAIRTYRPSSARYLIGTMELPVAQPQHPSDGDDRERMPAEPPRREQEAPPWPGLNAGHAQSLAPALDAGVGARRIRAWPPDGSRHPADAACHPPRVTARVTRWSAIIRLCLLQTSLRPRGLAGRLPQQLDDLRGPAKGVVVLPMHLSWPGMREFDVTDDSIRRSMYGMLLTQGRRNDVVRFVNARLAHARTGRDRGHRSTRSCAAGASGGSRWRERREASESRG